jgi:hypothetical protein
MSNEKQIILSLVGEPPIAFYRTFADLAGSAAGGVFFSQLMYWTGKSGNAEGWIYKTMDEWKEEACLTRSEQECARRELKKIGVLEEKLKGIPARLHYKINFKNLYDLLSTKDTKTTPPKAQSSLQKTTNKTAKNSKQDCKSQQTSTQISANQQAEFSNLNTENTAETIQILQPQQPDKSSSDQTIIFPPKISNEEKNAITQIIKELNPEIQNNLLAELEGAINKNTVRRSAISFIRGLVKKEQEGKFILDLGGAVLTNRNKLLNNSPLKVLITEPVTDLEKQKKGGKLFSPKFQNRGQHQVSRSG